MEVKLRFKDFSKVRVIENTNPSRAYSQLLNCVREFCSSEKYMLYWKDDNNDFIHFKDIDGFTVAMGLNRERITVFVSVLENVHQEKTCSMCHQSPGAYLYQCLGCVEILLCSPCFQKHQIDTGHFSILEKVDQYQIHPFLYHQLEWLVDKEAADDNITRICTFFQKVVLKLGLNIVEHIDINENERFRGCISLNEIKSNYNTTFNETIYPGQSIDDCDNEDIDFALNKMINMGFENKDNGLRNLLEKFSGNIPKTLDYMSRNCVAK